MDFPSDFAVTAYGDVSAQQLTVLREQYETSALLDIVDELDRLKRRLVVKVQ
ncbi:hypothetical protein SAMN02745857_03879 [Andreprevotia lacus DSM 23236]|jgi:hypothetical protein|uniref:Uncharacterized protein n=1 Tax=Andreprevotia lacus DSM 23236 TaxID=1121001 RepID=A0A1W1XZW6_9NEIS|nr:hypothetical protein SAMN02745857_03879 [Andreprevotia lacus DSM 23236]